MRFYTLNKNRELIAYYLGFKGKNQTPLIMLIKEYYNKNNLVYYADVLFSFG